MTLQSTGLTNGGLTQNFQVEYQDTLYTGLPASQQAQVKANLTANANYLLGVVEGAFSTTTGWFGTDTSKFGPSNRQQSLLDLADNSGANNTGYGNPINCDSQSKNSNISVAGPEVAMVWANEWAEILMSLTNGQWNAGDSSGEGLSQYTGSQLFLTGYNDYYPGGWVQNWLNGTGTTNQGPPTPNAARSDWVNTTFTGVNVGSTFVHGDGDPVSFGCAVGFINYLTVQLGFTINQVISTYSNNLASCYHALTGDSSDPFTLFSGLLASVYPPGTPASVPGPNPNNPFPIAEVQFYDQKNTFGKDETKDIIDSQGGLVSSAFWVAIDGFSQHSFQTLGIQVGTFTGSFTTLPGVKISPNPAGAQFENGVDSTTPQRIRIPFDITLSAPILGHFPNSGVSSPYGLSVSLTIGGNTVTGSQASTEFELIAGADPYFSNIDPSQDNQPYLSQDLRVFSAAPAINNVPFPGAPAFSTDSVGGATPTLTHCSATSTAIAASPTPTAQTRSHCCQISRARVIPICPSCPSPLTSTILCSRPSPTTTTSPSPECACTARPVHQARRTKCGCSSGCSGPRATTPTSTPNGTYLSQADAAGHPGTPLPGAGDTTIPFFATGNAASETDYQTGGPNIHTLTIPTGQDSLWWYFGCFLNFYDPLNQIAGQQVQAYLPGTHHCLVAQIAYDGAPIPKGSLRCLGTSWPSATCSSLWWTIPVPRITAPGSADLRLPTERSDRRTGRLRASARRVDDRVGQRTEGGDRLAVLASGICSRGDRAGARVGSTVPLGERCAHTDHPRRWRHAYIPIPSGTGQNFAGLFTLGMAPAFEAARVPGRGAATIDHAGPPRLHRRRHRRNCRPRSRRRSGTATRCAVATAGGSTAFSTQARQDPAVTAINETPASTRLTGAAQRRPPCSRSRRDRLQRGVMSSRVSSCASRSARPRRCWCRRRSPSPS